MTKYLCLVLFSISNTANACNFSTFSVSIKIQKYSCEVSSAKKTSNDKIIEHFNAIFMPDKMIRSQNIQNNLTNYWYATKSM